MTIYWVIGLIILAILVILFIFRMRLICAFFATFLIIIFLRSGVFIIYAGSQAVITQFGDIIGHPYTQAGIYLKVPLIWHVNYLEKRYIQEDEAQPEITTQDGYIISTDATFFWKISDGSTYISVVHDMKTAKRFLRNIVSGAVRQAVAGHTLYELIHSKEHNNTMNEFNIDELAKQSSINLLSATKTKSNKPDIGRTSILKDALKDINSYTKKLGIHVSNLVITKVYYTPETEKYIMERMVVERMREAARLRAIGVEKALKIDGLMKLNLQKILAPAEKESLIVRGKANAYAADIELSAYNKNRYLYNYWDTLQAYENKLSSKNMNMIISTNIPFLNFITSEKRVITRPNATATNKPHQTKRDNP